MPADIIVVPDSWLGPLLTAIAVGLYGALHSLLATPRVKGAAQHTFGTTAARYYRMVYNLLGGLTFIPVLFIVARFPGNTLYQITRPWLFFSMLGQFAAAILLVVGIWQNDALRFLGLRQWIDPESESAGKLSVQGLHGWVRHPLYSAGLLFIWLTPVMTTSVLLLNLSMTIYLYVGSVFEEQRLVDEFGDDYVKYQHEVPRLIPRRLRRSS